MQRMIPIQDVFSLFAALIVAALSFVVVVVMWSRERKRSSDMESALVGIFCNSYPDEPRGGDQCARLIGELHTRAGKELNLLWFRETPKPGLGGWRSEDGFPMRDALALFFARLHPTDLVYLSSDDGREVYTAADMVGRAQVFGLRQFIDAIEPCGTMRKGFKLCGECDGHGFGMHPDDVAAIERGENVNETARAAPCEVCRGTRIVPEDVRLPLCSVEGSAGCCGGCQ